METHKFFDEMSRLVAERHERELEVADHYFTGESKAQVMQSLSDWNEQMLEKLDYLKQVTQ